MGTNTGNGRYDTDMAKWENLKKWIRVWLGYVRLKRHFYSFLALYITPNNKHRDKTVISSICVIVVYKSFNTWLIIKV